MPTTTDAGNLFGDAGKPNPSGWKPPSAEEFAADLVRSHSRYLVKKLLGYGGMGAVYQAEDTRDTRLVAIKILRTDALHDDAFRHRFEKEIQSLRNLRHENIVACHDHGITPDGVPFLAMEFLEGSNLEELQRRKQRPPWRRVMEIMAAVCAGVHHAHAQGWVHRDLKASNVFITTAGRVVVLDFGLARQIGASAGTLTGRHGTMGTEGHIAPELRENPPAQATPVSDVFSLGVVFYEMLTGVIPQGRHRPLHEYRLDARLDAVVDKALSQHPADRYQSAMEFIEAIKAASEPAPPPLPVVDRSGAKPPPNEAVPVVSPYAAGELKLPFECVAVKVLHDQFTAVVGGVDGQIAAIDLRTGKVICTAAAEDSTHRKAYQGAGENSYIADAYFFLELAPARQCFYTMSHSAVLKTWSFDGRFRLISSVSLVTQNFDAIRAKILKARRSSGWSTWTCYDSEIPEGVPAGIVDAKLSPDGSSILCLTGWFGIFRCDLSGRLRDEPMVIADAFNIEPANADGSEVWVGRSVSGSGANLFRVVLKTGVGSGARVRATFGMQGIQAISPKILHTGTCALGLPSLSELGSSDLMSLGIGHRALVLPEIQRVLAASGSMLNIYDLDSLRIDGEPFIGGHEGDVRAVDATNDRMHVVSLAARSLRVWNLKTREPVGGYPSRQTFLPHGLYISYETRRTGATGNWKVYLPGYQSSRTMAALIDLRQRSVTRLDTKIEEIGVAAGHVDEVHVFSLGERAGSPVPGMKGLVARLLKHPPPKEYLLHHHVILSGGMTERAAVVLELNNNLIGWDNIYYQHSVRGSTAIDIGNGRIAVLAAGHLAIYDLNSKAIVSGPIDISRPSEKAENWIYYTQVIVSPDGLKLFVRGDGLPIKVFNSLNLQPLGEIHGTAGKLGLLVPWIDSRHVLFSQRGGSTDVVALGDFSAGRIIGKLGDGSWCSDSPHKAVLLGGGATLAVGMRFLDLVSGRWQEAPYANHSINSIHLCPNPDEIMTTSSDGTARFWNIRGLFAEQPDPLASMLRRAEPIL